LDIPDVLLIEPKVFQDERDFFIESYKKSDFEAAGIVSNFVQDNHSRSKKGSSERDFTISLIQRLRESL